MASGVSHGTTVSLVVAVLLTGCAVGPDFATPAAPSVDGYTPEPLTTATVSAATAGGAPQHFVHDLDLPGQWWTLFHSTGLNNLVEKALAANPDLQAAQAALIVAKENVYAQQGALFPTVDGNFTASRQIEPIGEPSDVAHHRATYNLFTTQLNVSYTPDVFGGTRRAIEVAGRAGRCPALCARGDLPDPDLKSRRRGRAGGLAARPDRGDAQHHQDRDRRAQRDAASTSILATSPRATWWRRKRRWRRSSRPCRRCKSS